MPATPDIEVDDPDVSDETDESSEPSAASQAPEQSQAPWLKYQSKAADTGPWMKYRKPKAVPVSEFEVSPPLTEPTAGSAVLPPPPAPGTTPVDKLNEGVAAAENFIGEGATGAANLLVQPFNAAQGLFTAGMNKLTGQKVVVPPIEFKKDEPMVPAFVPKMAGAATSALTEALEGGYGPTPSSEAAGRFVEKNVSGLTTPGAVATYPLLEARIGRGAMATLMAAHVPAQLEETERVLRDPKATRAEKIEAVADATLAVGMPVGLAASLGGPKSPPGGPPARPQAELPPNLAAAEKALPRTAAAAKQAISEQGGTLNPPINETRPPEQPTTTEVPNASGEQKTTEIHGGLRTQPIVNEGKVPQPPGERGVLPQAGGGLPEEANPPGAQPEPREVEVSQHEADHKEYQSLKEQLAGLTVEQRFSSDIPKRINDIMNRYGGFAPPEPIPGLRFDHAMPGAEGKKLWQFTVQDNGPAHNSSFTVPAGSPADVIQAKWDAKHDQFNVPKPDWSVTVQGAQGEVPGYVQIDDRPASQRGTETGQLGVESRKPPTMESLKAAGHEVPDFSKLPTGKYTWAEAVAKAKEIVDQPVNKTETLYHQTAFKGPITELKPPVGGPEIYYLSDRKDVLDRMIKGGASKDITKPSQTFSVEVTHKSPLDLSEHEGKDRTPADWGRIFEKAGVRVPESLKAKIRSSPLRSVPVWEFLKVGHDDLRRAILDAGYDAVKFKEWGGTTTAVFSKNQLKVKPVVSSRRIPSYTRPPDVLDALEGTGKINIASARAIREGYNPPAAARKYFDFSNQSSGIDKVLQGVHQSPAGNFTSLADEEALLDAIDKAGPARVGMRGAQAQERKAVKVQQVQDSDFKASVVEGKGTTNPPVKLGNVVKEPGETFMFQGQKFTVASYDEANDEYILDDGRRFGRQKLSGEEMIHPDPTTPKLRTGEKGTGELLQGGDQPFNLAGETGTDADRIAAAKAKAAADAAEAKRIADEQQGQFPAGPGAATNPGNVPTGPDLPVEPGNPDTFGIAERVRKQREAAGQTAPTQPGEGISAPDSVEHGRELLGQGKDPEAAMAQFEKTKRLSADDMALVRAHGEALAKAARNIEQKFGTGSPEYKVAWDALSAWDKRSKAMQTEWHKTGQAQQGETDIDTGTFTGLQRAFKDVSGKDFNPKQAAEAKAMAERVRAAEAAAAEAQRKLLEASKPPPIDPVVKRIMDRLGTILHTQRDAALARIKARGTRLNIGLDPTELADYAIVGASHIYDGALEFGKWSERMLNDFGEGIRSHLADVFKASNERFDKNLDSVAGKPVAEKVKKAIIPATPRDAVWAKVKSYIESGLDDFDTIRNKIATDLGMSVDQVTKLITESRPMKRLADDVWKKQQTARQIKEQAKRWLTNADSPLYKRALQSIPRVMFGLKVGFHGTVALGTHAPMVAFQPRFWANYVRDFGKMYRMVGSPAYYERQVQDLLRRPNFITARRAGLVNDPFSYEDYNSPDVAKYFGRLSGMGNRGYSVLKILRQDMFDQHWNKLPENLQTPEVAEAVANGVNHATGVVKGMAPKGANIALFAPRLMASRAMWLGGDPVKAADTFLRWNKATDAEKQFAISQVKEKAWVLGTAAGLLALNQGILTATGSKQKVNLTDPMKSDFMKFKVGGMNFSYGNAMLTMARLPVRLFQIRASSGGKTRNLIYPDEDVYSVLGEYGRSQMSPFASLAADLWFRSDWMRRQLPGSNRPMPARLRKQGVKPYTWPEFLSEQVLPIPAEEAVREVWQHGLGMNPQQVSAMKKALATIAVMGATGARLSDDTEAKK